MSTHEAPESRATPSRYPSHGPSASPGGPPDPRDTLLLLAKADPLVAAALERVQPLPDRRRPCTYATFARIVAGQQLSVKAAASIYGRLEHVAGGCVEAAQILSLDDDALRGAGLSRAKVAALRDLANAVQSGVLDLGSLPTQSDEDVRTQLLARRGIGPWTVDMVQLFVLGRPDVWPVGDLGVRAGLQRLLTLPQRPSPKEAETLGQRWAPHRSGIALLCWRLLHVEGPFDS